jgi:serine/threonine-protein kinase SRPK3
MRKDLVPEAFTLANSILSLEGGDKQEFLNFAQKMLQWLPKKRKSAKELLEDPWLCLDSM